MTPCTVNSTANDTTSRLAVDAARRPSRWFAGWRARLHRWQRLHRERRELLELSDALLKDIGLTRADARREAHRPFWDGDGGRP